MAFAPGAVGQGEDTALPQTQLFSMVPPVRMVEAIARSASPVHCDAMAVIQYLRARQNPHPLVREVRLHYDCLMAVAFSLALPGGGGS